MGFTPVFRWMWFTPVFRWMWFTPVFRWIWFTPVFRWMWFSPVFRWMCCSIFIFCVVVCRLLFVLYLLAIIVMYVLLLLLLITYLVSSDFSCINSKPATGHCGWSVIVRSYYKLIRCHPLNSSLPVVITTDNHKVFELYCHILRTARYFEGSMV